MKVHLEVGKTYSLTLKDEFGIVETLSPATYLGPGEYFGEPNTVSVFDCSGEKLNVDTWCIRKAKEQ